MNAIKKLHLGRTGLLLFTREIIANPKKIGAAFPSSKHLARSMAREIPKGTAGYVVELGAGTGVVTWALLEQGIDAKKIRVIERSPSLAEFLLRRFPALNIIQGDADNLAELLGEKADQVSVIVSSLPLRSLPAEKIKKITQQIDKTLPKGGRFIQFTYNLRKKQVMNHHLKRVKTKYVWRNIPPARIDVFEKM